MRYMYYLQTEVLSEELGREQCYKVGLPVLLEAFSYNDPVHTSTSTEGEHKINAVRCVSEKMHQYTSWYGICSTSVSHSSYQCMPLTLHAHPNSGECIKNYVLSIPFSTSCIL